MTRKELYNIRKSWLNRNVKYRLLHFDQFNYEILSNIMYRRKSGRGFKETVNEVIIMADTETSKKPNSEENHVVAWTISIRAFDRNIVTLYGHRPSEFCKTVRRIINNMDGDKTYFYWHNMSYDWTFIERFMFREFGYPDKQLNTKSHYPILIEWENGIVFKDSLILAQKSLERWAKDMDVEHQKAVGKWDYDKLRNQSDTFTISELKYIENDTLAGVECLDALCKSLNKTILSLPLLLLVFQGKQ